MLYILSYGGACVCRRREALTRKSESVSMFACNRTSEHGTCREQSNL